ncbi:DUF2059 domain-containing protein [Shewanella sedimentimangrovi]|uniref:DUF2059 domain-containing protein n=1 Tax=Shewanella sedimentimangrovi TaxID=2814293 RepID=A0ABX7R0I5_9GAMM|nr:DUF2059 domain-containing protein [Shewanella sedimentimangrovi]QSX36730.1 hypothetical protein JYB85_15850 [Shewanella sedimentimangrovi]
MNVKYLVIIPLFFSTIANANEQPSKAALQVVVELNSVNQAIEGFMYGACNPKDYIEEICSAAKSFSMPDADKKQLENELAALNDKYFELSTLSEIAEFFSTNTGKLMLAHFRYKYRASMGDTSAEEVKLTESEQKKILEFMNSPAYKKFNIKTPEFNQESNSIIYNAVGDSFRKHILSKENAYNVD